MSRLWNKPRLCVFLGEDRLVACRLGAGRRGPLLHSETLPLPSGEDAAATLDAWLARQPAAEARLDIRLGVPHVRYLVLPWDAQLAQEDFRHTVARALLARQFPQAAATPEIRFAPATYGQPLLAAGVDATLRPALEAAAARHGARLRALEPLLAVVWNHFHSRLRSARTLALAEPTRLLRVQCEAGVITEVQVRPWDPDAADAQLQAQAADATVRVFTPTQPALAGARPEAWLGVQGDDGLPVAGDMAYALCGVA